MIVTHLVHLIFLACQETQDRRHIEPHADGQAVRCVLVGLAHVADGQLLVFLAVFDRPTSCSCSVCVTDFEKARSLDEGLETWPQNILVCVEQKVSCLARLVVVNCMVVWYIEIMLTPRISQDLFYNILRLRLRGVAEARNELLWPGGGGILVWPVTSISIVAVFALDASRLGSYRALNSPDRAPYTTDCSPASFDVASGCLSRGC